MTAKMTSLIEDAKRAGYEVKTVATSTMIMKRVGRWQKLVGLIVYQDGTALDITVDPSAAKGLRSYKDMRSILGI